jgi:hypothetical protein
MQHSELNSSAPRSAANGIIRIRTVATAIAVTTAIIAGAAILNDNDAGSCCYIGYSGATICCIAVIIDDSALSHLWKASGMQAIVS